MANGRILNIPNVLTLTRVALIPVFLLIAYWPPMIGVNGHDGGLLRHSLLAGVFVLAAVTDWLDGYLARALNQSSAFGRFLDPVADKLMVAAALVILVQWHSGISMVISAIVIISREITISALREWMAEIGKRANVAVSSIGKWKTTAQMASITVLLVKEPRLDMIGFSLMFVAVALTLWSMIIYLKAAWPDLKQSA
jgi:CDP-diacylglycerol--glycerol-3-phosphate 3-phosphatidyltransferase